MEPRNARSHTIHLILGTHWDREWLYPFEYTQAMLVNMMDKLLSFMESNPAYSCFHLDSQAIIVEDYLRAKPENSERLRSLIQQGRIQVGPYYSLLEEHHLLGESIIRNLFIGDKVARQYGSTMKVGYSPTGYGRISQFPQILKSAGIDNVIFYRGLQQDRSKAEFLWEGPDKSQILGIRLSGPTGRGTFICNLITPVFFTEGVEVEDIMIVQNDLHNPQSIERGFMDVPGCANKRTTDPRKVVDTFKEVEEFLAADTVSDCLLLIHAEDYGSSIDFVLETAETVNREAGYDKLKISSLPEFMTAFRKSLLGKELTTLKGELHDTRKTARDFPLVMSGLSSIGPVKIANRKAELAVGRYAELWDTIIGVVSGQGQPQLVENAWKDLLASHAHDSVGGQGTDEVIDTVHNRLVRVKQTADGIAEMSMKKLVNSIKMPAADGGTVFLTVFNVSGSERNDVIDLHIDMPFNRPDKQGNVFLSEMWSDKEKAPDRFIDPEQLSLHIQDSHGNDVDFAVNAIEPLKPIGISHSEWGKRRLCSHRFTCSISAEHIPAMGYKVLSVKYAGKKTQPGTIKNISCAPNQLENEFLHVHINANGTMDVQDKKTGHQYRELLKFEDSLETGHMTQAKSSQAMIFDAVAAEITLRENNHLCATYEIRSMLRIPACASANRAGRSEQAIGVEVCSLVTLKGNSSVIDAVTKVVNTAKDHRLRMLFPTDIATKTAFVDQPYDIIERAIVPDGMDEERVEKPCTVLGLQSFVDINDGAKGIAVMTIGLLEYEIVPAPTNTIAITLLRCFQNINKFCANLDFQSKQSQLPGEHEFKYALYFHAGDVWRGRVHQKSEEHMLPLKAVQSYRKICDGLASELSFIHVDNPEISVGSVKRSETGDGIVVRVYNNTGKTIDSALYTWRPVAAADEVDSLEQFKCTLKHSKNMVRICLAAKRFMSVKISFA